MWKFGLGKSSRWDFEQTTLILKDGKAKGPESTICFVHISFIVKLQSCQNPTNGRPHSLLQLHSLIHWAHPTTVLPQILSQLQPKGEQTAEVNVAGVGIG